VKPRGRPRVDRRDTSQQVCVTLSTKEYDRLCAEARRGDLSIPAVIRKAIERRLKPRQ